MKTILWTLLVLGAHAAQAEVAPYIPSHSGVYGYMEKLEALGCAYPTLRALGPQSFSDIRAALDWDPEKTSCSAPEWLMDERQLLIRPALPLEFRSDGFTAQDDQVNLSGISASLWPTFPGRQNRITFNGVNLSNELSLSGRAGGQDWGYSGALTPGFYAGLNSPSSILGRFYLQEGYVKVGYGYSELSFGRYARRFGDSRHGSLLFSAATAPLDTWEYTLRPYVLGGALSNLGPISFRAWVSNQGADSAVPFTQLWGMEFAMRPFHWWEFAFAELFQFHGNGAPGLNPGDFLSMALGGGGSGLANYRNASVSLYSGFWGPSRFVKAYGQVLWNRVGDNIDAPFSYQVGVWFPKLEKLDLRFEYARTATQAYRHPFWTQGLTYAGSPLGHPLGPDAEGLYVDLGLPPIATWWHSEVGALYEARMLNPGAGQATERRYGVSLTTGRRWGLMDLRANVVYHQVQGSQYVPNAGLDVFGVGAVFRYTFLY